MWAVCVDHVREHPQKKEAGKTKWRIKAPPHLPPPPFPPARTLNQNVTRTLDHYPSCSRLSAKPTDAGESDHASDTRPCTRTSYVNPLRAGIDDCAHAITAVRHVGTWALSSGPCFISTRCQRAEGVCVCVCVGEIGAGILRVIASMLTAPSHVDGARSRGDGPGRRPSKDCREKQKKEEKKRLHTTAVPSTSRSIDLGVSACNYQHPSRTTFQSKS